MVVHGLVSKQSFVLFRFYLCSHARPRWWWLTLHGVSNLQLNLDHDERKIKYRENMGMVLFIDF